MPQGAWNMTDQFQHVMVLTSLIICLGITHLLSGVSTAIDLVCDKRRNVRLSWASGFWLAFVFLWMILFWWWEFRLLDTLRYWSLWNYFVVVGYAMVLFFMVALLVPRDWDGIDDMDEYFLSKRHWFYSAFLLASCVDVVDSYMKGGVQYLSGLGIICLGTDMAAFPAALIGFKSARIRVHAVMGFAYLVSRAVVGFNDYPLLHRLS